MAVYHSLERAHPVSLALGLALARAWRWVQACRARARQRRELAALAECEHLLRDIGVTRAEAMREAGKPFWRA